MFVFLLGFVWKKEFETLKPDPDTLGLYGRAVAVNTKYTTLAVSASWDGYQDANYTDNDKKTAHSPGSVYIYEFDPEQLKWTYKTKISPKDTENVQIFNFGSTLQISASGNRIVGGAPYSNVKNDAGNWIQQVGAIVIFDKDKNGEWKQNTVLTVKNPVAYTDSGYFDEYQGLGRSMSTDNDCQYIASAYYNKPNFDETKSFQGIVWTAQEKEDGTFTDLVAIRPEDVYSGLTLKGKMMKFGSDLQFTDASHLLIATQIVNQNKNFAKEFGTVYMKRDGESWKVDSIISVPSSTRTGLEFFMYGHTVSMPTDTQTRFATMGLYEKANGDFYSNGTFFIFEQKEDKTWEVSQTIEFEGDATFGTIEFCTKDVFLNQITNYKFKDEPDKTYPAVLVYRQNSEGKFEISEVLKGPYYNEEERVHYQFGSAEAWGNDCKSIFIGAQSKVSATIHTPYEGSHVLFFSQGSETIPDDQDSGKVNLGLAVGLPVVFIIIAIVIIVIIILVLKKNKKETHDTASAENV